MKQQISLQEALIKQFNHNQTKWISDMYFKGVQSENRDHVHIILEELDWMRNAILNDTRVTLVTFDTYNQLQTVIQMVRNHAEYLKCYCKGESKHEQEGTK